MSPFPQPKVLDDKRHLSVALLQEQPPDRVYKLNTIIVDVYDLLTSNIINIYTLICVPARGHDGARTLRFQTKSYTT